MKIIDTSGEFIFYKTHDMVFSPSTVFLVVLNATKGLDEVLPQSHSIGRNKFDYPDTSRKFLDYFLNSISTVMSKNFENSGKPCAIIVLTHTDLLDHTKKREIEKEIERHLQKQYACKYVFPQILSLSNKERRDWDFANLKVQINNLCQSRAAFGLEQPCVWLNLQTEIDDYCRVRKQRYLTLSELQDNVAQIVNMSLEDVRKFLKFHSNCGNIIFLDDSTMDSLVITDLQLLVDVFKAVWVLKDVKHRGFAFSCQDELMTGIKRGIISEESLLQALRDVNCLVTRDMKHLVTILVSFSQFIPCEVNHSPKQYIVPALLPPYDPSKLPLGPCTTVDRAKTLVYLFHQLQGEQGAKTSGFLPNNLFLLFVSSIVKPSWNESCWELIKIFGNAAAFRAGSRGQFILSITGIASVITLNIHLAGELKFEGQKCEISSIRAVFEAHMRYILYSHYPNVHCSVCVSPCEKFIESVKKHKYHCLQILGCFGKVGSKPLKTAICFKHKKQIDTEENHDCWYCNEINERKLFDCKTNTEQKQSLRDQMILSNVAEKVSDISVLRKLGLHLGVTLRDTDRRFYDSNSQIAEAALSVLYYDWYEKEGEYLTQGSSSLHKLQQAVDKVGISCRLR